MACTPSRRARGDDTGPRDAEPLLVAQEVRDGERPAIVAGDLNDVAWSDTTRLFQEVSGMLDPRIGCGLYPTFNAELPLLRWPLDHVFFEEEFGLLGIERLPYTGSDHFPLAVELCLRPNVAYRQWEPRLDAEAIEDAQEAIREGREEVREEEEDE